MKAFMNLFTLVFQTFINMKWEKNSTEKNRSNKETFLIFLIMPSRRKELGECVFNNLNP